MALRAHMKRALEKALFGLGVPVVGAYLNRRKVVILSYHNVVPDADPPVGDASLHMPLSRFQYQLDALDGYFQVVPLETLMADPVGAGPRASSRPSDGPRIQVAITFDDAYRGALTLGLAELGSRGLPSTVFVCPGLLGCDGFWWDRLADPAAGLVSRRVQSHVLNDLGGRQEKALAWARERCVPLQEMTGLYRPVSSEELAEASAFCSLGSHTWGHANLTTIPENEAYVQLERPLTWLRERNPETPPMVTYPYGLTSEPVQGLVDRLGYAAGFLVEGGPTGFRSLARRRFRIPRLNIPRGISMEGFVSRVSGVWP